MLSLIFGSSAALFLQCTYTVSETDYICTGQVIFVGDRRIISEVSFNHLIGRNDSDVTQLYINNQTVGFIPLNVNLFFPYLERFDMENSTVAELTKDSLKGLHRLKAFRILINQIESIHGDFFIDNSELNWITFSSNPIKHIAHRVFDHLTQLTQLYFQTTTCINNSFSTNRADTELLIFRLLVNCPPRFEMIETQIIEGDKLEDKTNSQIHEQINPLTEEIKVLRQRLDRLEGLK